MPKILPPTLAILLAAEGVRVDQVAEWELTESVDGPPTFRVLLKAEPTSVKIEIVKDGDDGRS
jgi:hypothetical protein